MRVFILTEAGQKVGFGHLSRCSAVYHAFVRSGIKPVMIVNGDQGISDFLKGIHHDVFDWLGNFPELLSRIAGADIVFIDSYLADLAKYQDIAASVSLIACVDDYKRIRYPQGVVINGLIYAPQMNYPRVKGIEYLLGTRYTFLRKAFWNVPDRKTSKQIRNIFITFGGNDVLDLTPKVLKAVVREYPGVRKTVAASRYYPSLDVLRKAADKYTKVIVDATDQKIRRLMMGSDVAVSGSGLTLSELAVLGVPGVAVCMAPSQEVNFKIWTQKGFVAAGPNAGSVILALKKLNDPGIRHRFSQKLRKAISPSGTFAIVDALLRRSPSGLDRFGAVARPFERRTFRQRRRCYGITAN
jgi:UDP-2,4-diacetamido-2,4,6-trideoxy-beta-L-altropyranose hydrolase